MSYKIESNGSVYTPVQQMEQPFIVIGSKCAGSLD